MHLICSSDASDLTFCAENLKDVNTGMESQLQAVLAASFEALMTSLFQPWYLCMTYSQTYLLQVVILEAAAAFFAFFMCCGLRRERRKKSYFLLMKGFLPLSVFCGSHWGLQVGLTVCLVLLTYRFVPSCTILMLCFCPFCLFVLEVAIFF